MLGHPRQSHHQPLARPQPRRPQPRLPPKQITPHTQCVETLAKTDDTLGDWRSGQEHSNDFDFRTDVLPTEVLLAEARVQVARTHELDRAHVFHSWSAQAEIDPMTIVAAQGSYVWDGDGRRLLDFSSQLVNTNIGHQHPKVIAHPGTGRQAVHDRAAARQRGWRGCTPVVTRC
jgi:hypothetical protein